VGKKADLVLIETESVNMFPIHDPYAVLVYSAQAHNVDSVWVNGIQRVQNKKLVHYDIKEIIKETSDQMKEFNRMEKEISDSL
jgi:cytosine/adenosine deaminase-related metal-dependent hydrolase